jgi:hypothetical protein
MKYVTNELSFFLVTHITCLDIWFDPHEFFNSDFHTDKVVDNMDIQVLGQVFGSQGE